jgi:hypothetical protein
MLATFRTRTFASVLMVYATTWKMAPDLRGILKVGERCPGADPEIRAVVAERHSGKRTIEAAQADQAHGGEKLRLHHHRDSQPPPLATTACLRVAQDVKRVSISANAA